MTSFLHCYGDGCPIKETCLRFKEKINPRKQYHLGKAPYTHEEKKCSSFVGINGDNIESQIIFYLKANENGSRVL